MTTFSESTASDWDTNQSESGVHHEQPANTDWAPADQIEKGYPSSDRGGSALEGYWPLDEDSGTTAYDVSGNARDATRNGATVGVSGIFGSTAYNFDGTDDYVSIGDLAVFDQMSALSISTWVNLDSVSTGENQCVVGKIGGDTDTWRMIYHNTNDFFRWDITDNNGSTHFLQGPTGVSTGQWYHLIGTYDGSAGTLAFYIDGTEVDSTTGVGSSIAASTNAVELGKGGDNWWNLSGTLDECRIYSRSLSASEVSDHYDAGVGTSDYWADKHTI